MFDQVRVLSLNHDVELVTWKENGAQIARKIRGGDPFGARVKVTCLAQGKAGRETVGQRLWRTLKSLVGTTPSPAEFYFPISQDFRDRLPEVDIAIYHYSYAWNWLSSSVGGIEAKKILHFHNVESDLYELRGEKEQIAPLRFIHRLNAQKLRKIETNLPRLVDECWYVSGKDADEFRNRFEHPAERQRVRPPSYDASQLRERQHRFIEWQARHQTSRPVLGFVGTLDFDPNIMSLEWILDRLCPELLKHGWSGSLRIVGRNPSPELMAKMARYPFVDYLGFLSDMEDFWSSLSAFLIPHVEGSGVRVKLLDAMASGIPTLANSAAVERIDSTLVASPLLWVSDNPNEWVQRILGLEGHRERQAMAQRPLEQALNGEIIYGDFRE